MITHVALTGLRFSFLLVRFGDSGLFIVCRCSEIIGTVVSLLLGIPGLDWSRPSTHVETFAGCQSVTFGEIKAGFQTICACPC